MLPQEQETTEGEDSSTKIKALLAKKKGEMVNTQGVFGDVCVYVPGRYLLGGEQGREISCLVSASSLDQKSCFADRKSVV